MLIGRSWLIDFEYLPGRPQARQVFFDVGTAGSTGPVFRRVLPALLFAGGPSSLSIKGGTHVPWSPVPEYLEGVFLRAVRPMGFEVSLKCTGADIILPGRLA
ncbi:MAG: hypothetical protein HS130_05635 [Deltaproteobacteria bacterium]|nr:hypothetical protein [Deltaproteobacteria bacterium]